MKVLITGGAGFLGRRLAKRLLQKGVLKNAEGEEERIDQLVLFDAVPVLGFSDPRVRVVQGDVADAATVGTVIDAETASIFHLAAVVSSQSEDDFDLGMRVVQPPVCAHLQAQPLSSSVEVERRGSLGRVPGR